MSRYSFSSWLQDALRPSTQQSVSQEPLELEGCSLHVPSFVSKQFLLQTLKDLEVSAQEIQAKAALLQSECQALRSQLQEYQRND